MSSLGRWHWQRPTHECKRCYSNLTAKGKCAAIYNCHLPCNGFSLGVDHSCTNILYRNKLYVLIGNLMIRYWNLFSLALLIRTTINTRVSRTSQLSVWSFNCHRMIQSNDGKQHPEGGLRSIITKWPCILYEILIDLRHKWAMSLLNLLFLKVTLKFNQPS